MEPSLSDLIAGRRVVASISGGKDSAAMSLWLHEQGIPHERVHLLTGWDAQATLDYLRGELTRKLGPIAELRGDLLMPELIRKKGMFPSRVRRWCTEELKVRPLAAYLRSLMDAGQDVLSAVGVRAAESAARAHLPELEWSDALDCEVWRPLLSWTEEQVIDIHRRHDLRPNPLYLMGATRVGCWPCIMARKAEVRLVAEQDPGRIDEIRELEQDLTAQLKARCAESGEEQRWPELTFFQGPNAGSRVGGQTWPIDKVVEWSRTSRGGRQLELLAPDGESGCMRWGLCGS